MYEKRETAEGKLKFMEHFVLVMVEELSEVLPVRKQCCRDGKNFVEGQF
jgi:hypothetical protein